jgi:hypothetical protein
MYPFAAGTKELLVPVPRLVGAFVALGIAVAIAPDPFVVGSADVKISHAPLELLVTRTKKPKSLIPAVVPADVVMTVALSAPFTIYSNLRTSSVELFPNAILYPSTVALDKSLSFAYSQKYI